MQTFLPYPDIKTSVECLDFRRLGKQRVEAKQIIDTLTFCKTSWKNHPAVKMWKYHVPFLSLYMNACIDEWIKRGYKNTMQRIIYPEGYMYSSPLWWGNKLFHESHRSNLLRKDPIWYGQYGWKEPNNLPYYWPV